MPRLLDNCGTMRVVRLTSPTRECCCCMPLPPWLVQWLRGGLRLSGNTTVAVKSLGQWCLASTSGTTSVGETHFNIHMSAYANPLSDHGTVVHYSCPPATSHNNAIRRHGWTRTRAEPPPPSSTRSPFTSHCSKWFCNWIFGVLMTAITARKNKSIRLIKCRLDRSV